MNIGDKLRKMNNRQIAIEMRALINSCANCPCWSTCRKMSRQISCVDTIEEWLNEEYTEEEN